MTLTAKQQRFVEEYLVDSNATQACIRAGYSAKTADKQGWQLLVKTSIAAAIALAQADRTARTHITMDYVVQRLAIEAEREGEGATHSARVAALGQLRQHFTEQGAGGSKEVADVLREMADRLNG